MSRSLTDSSHRPFVPSYVALALGTLLAGPIGPVTALAQEAEPEGTAEAYRTPTDRPTAPAAMALPLTDGTVDSHVIYM